MNGWPVVGWATVAVLAIVGIIFAVVGTDELGLRIAFRSVLLYGPFAGMLAGSMMLRWSGRRA